MPRNVFKKYSQRQLLDCITDNLRLVLQNNVSVKALSDPENLTSDHIYVDGHFYDRISAIANACLALDKNKSRWPTVEWTRELLEKE